MTNQIKVFVIVIVVLILGTIITAVTRGGAGPETAGKFDQFASCLKEKGVVFYGAFWCPHCQAQKKLFGSSAVKLLEYKECSTPDGNAQTPICIEKKIRSYPTWSFPESLHITSTEAPHKCTDSADESEQCKQSYNTDFGSFIFPSLKANVVASKVDPVQKDNVWTFVPDSRITGEVELETLAEQSGCVLPE